MKNILRLFPLLAFALLAYLPTNATHLMGGDIGVTKDANGAYILEHVNFRDTLGIPAYAQAQYHVEKWDTSTSAWVHITSGSMPQDTVNSGGLLVGIPYGIEVYRYKSDAGDLDTIFANNGVGKYRFITKDCCRNIAIQNLTNPGSESFVITCEYTYDPAPTASQYSPEFLAIPIIYGPINNAWVYNPLPFDADADSLSWSMNTPHGKYTPAGGIVNCVGYTTPPAAATGPFTLNSATGQVDWTPNTLGNFVASFEITEYKNGVEIGSVLRDMQYVVIPDSNANGPIAMPEFTPITSYNQQQPDPNENNGYNYMYYNPGVPLSFTIGATDQNNGDVLTMTAFGELLNNGSNAAFSFVSTGSGNQVNGTFTWTPNATDSKDFVIVIRANDGAFSKDFTLVLRKWVAPTTVNNLANDLNITVYPNPVKANSQVSLQINTNENMRDVQLQIVDISGKIIEAQNLNVIHAGTTDIKLNENLQTGFYFAKVIAKDESSRVIKFVVH